MKPNIWEYLLNLILQYLQFPGVYKVVRLPRRGHKETH
jgi:hypothetical protein